MPGDRPGARGQMPEARGCPGTGVRGPKSPGTGDKDPGNPGIGNNQARWPEPGARARSRRIRTPRTRGMGLEEGQPGAGGTERREPGSGTSNQVRGAHCRRCGAKSPVRRARKRAMRTGMMIVGVRNMMMIVLLLVLYLRSVNSMFNHMVFQRAF